MAAKKKPAPKAPLTASRAAANRLLNAAALPINDVCNRHLADAITEAIDNAVAQALIAAVQPEQGPVRIALAALVRCGVSATAQSKARQAHERSSIAMTGAEIGRRADALKEACYETNAAGTALAKALRAIRKGAK